MAITPVFMDGFDDGVAVIAGSGWLYAAVNGAATAPSSVAGRTGQAIRLPVYNDNTTATQRQQSPYRDMSSLGSGSHVVGGFAFRQNGAMAWDGPAHWGNFVITGSASLCLTIETDGSLALRNGATKTDTVIATSSPAIFGVGTWVSIQFLVKHGAAGTGRFIVKINGGTTVIDTAVTITGIYRTQFASCRNWPTGASQHADVDDFWVGTATADSDLPDDIRIYTLSPDGNGSVSQGTGSDGNSTDNYLLVDETTISTTDYVDLSVGERDLYSAQNLPFTNGTIYAVQPRASLERTDAGSITAQPVIKLGANETVVTGSQPAFGSVSHTVFPIQLTKPGGGSWTVSDVNDAEYGMEGA